MAEMTGVCLSCGAPIRYVRTSRTRDIAIDPGPHPEGNIDLTSGRAIVVNPAEILPGVPLYRSHHVSCPHGKDWRKS